MAESGASLAGPVSGSSGLLGRYRRRGARGRVGSARRGTAPGREACDRPPGAPAAWPRQEPCARPKSWSCAPFGAPSVLEVSRAARPARRFPPGAPAASHRARELGHGGIAVAHQGLDRPRSVGVADQGEPGASTLVAAELEQLGFHAIGAGEPPGGDPDAPGQHRLHHADGRQLLEERRLELGELRGILLRQYEVFCARSPCLSAFFDERALPPGSWGRAISRRSCGWLRHGPGIRGRPRGAIARSGLASPDSWGPNPFRPARAPTGSRAEHPMREGLMAGGAVGGRGW